MRTRLTFFLLLLTAFSASAQFPPRTVTHYPAVRPPAEIRFVDGNVDNYAIMRIGKDVMRVEVGGDQSTRMPLTYVESIRFQDGCTLYFDKGELLLDRLVQPARLMNEGGDAVLEGVLKLTGPQAESLMGPDLYRQFRKKSGHTAAQDVCFQNRDLQDPVWYMDPQETDARKSGLYSENLIRSHAVICFCQALSGRNACFPSG